MAIAATLAGAITYMAHMAQWAMIFGGGRRDSDEEGSGGGLELQHVNGSDVARNPRTPSKWYGIEITNNIFANNVAGWDGGGVSLHDAVKVDFINNTVVSNDSTASAGVLFDTVNRFYVAQEHREIMARFPSERASWHAVRHMYEIGRAPENKQHPDHALAQDLARGFWASLPYLDKDLITFLLSRARRIAKPDEFAALVAFLASERASSINGTTIAVDGGWVKGLL